MRTQKQKKLVALVDGTTTQQNIVDIFLFFFLYYFVRFIFSYLSPSFESKSYNTIDAAEAASSSEALYNNNV